LGVGGIEFRVGGLGVGRKKLQLFNIFNYSTTMPQSCQSINPENSDSDKGSWELGVGGWELGALSLELGVGSWENRWARKRLTKKELTVNSEKNYT
jgi:hypothetical protein